MPDSTSHDTRDLGASQKHLRRIIEDLDAPASRTPTVASKRAARLRARRAAAEIPAARWDRPRLVAAVLGAGALLVVLSLLAF